MLISQHSSFRLASRGIQFWSTYAAYRSLLPYQCSFPLRSPLWMQDSQWRPTFCGIVAVTIVNYTLSYFHLFDGIICYHWYEALPVALIIVATLYPIILLGKKYFPVLIGRKNT